MKVEKRETKVITTEYVLDNDVLVTITTDPEHRFLVLEDGTNDSVFFSREEAVEIYKILGRHLDKNVKED